MTDTMQPAPKKRRFRGLADRILGAKPKTPDPIRDPEGLRALVRADRVRRRMTWPVYADFLGMSVSTIYKIATGVHKPTEITEAVIRERIGEHPAE